MNKKIIKNYMRGFTLIELLIVIGVIAVLASLMFVALNPLARFQESRNVERRASILSILSGLKLHQVDNGGIYLDVVNDLTPDLHYMIGAGDLCNKTCLNPTVALQANCADLRGLIDGGYLQEIPYDPIQADAGANHTYYYIVKHTNGALTIGSCMEEKGSADTVPDISVSR